MNNKVIYTCIVGHYDSLLQPTFVRDDYDYICFTNDIKEDFVGIWKIKKIPFEGSNNLRVSRYVKLLPHIVLQDYKYSIWMDANICIKTNEFYDKIEEHIIRGTQIAQLPHLLSNCIYKEIRNAYYGRKVNAPEAIRQYRHIKSMGFPKAFGLFENNVIFRKHNDLEVVSISKDWWDEYCRYSERDQFSLMYIYWLHKYMPAFLFDDKHNSRNLECLEYIYHPSHLIKLQKEKEISIVKRATYALYKRIIIKLFLD